MKTKDIVMQGNPLLEQHKTNLEEARTTLDHARTAMREGRFFDADDLVELVSDHLFHAINRVESFIDDDEE